MGHELTVPVLTPAGATEWRVVALDEPLDLEGLLVGHYTVTHLWDEETDTCILTLPEAHPVLPFAYFRAGGWYAFASDLNYPLGYRRVLELTDLALTVAKLRLYRKGDKIADQLLPHLAQTIQHVEGVGPSPNGPATGRKR